MAPPNKKRSAPRSTDTRNRVRRGKPKFCIFCAEHAQWVDYKDTNILRRFISDRGKIKSRGNTGTCAQHQRDVAAAIKTARELALLPYVVRTLAADKAGGRRGRPGGAGGPGGRPDAPRTPEGDSASGGEADAPAADPEAETVPAAV
jgi:small subunit ribosomal protein S18